MYKVATAAILIHTRGVQSVFSLEKYYMFTLVAMQQSAAKRQWFGKQLMVDVKYFYNFLNQNTYQNIFQICINTLPNSSLSQ